MTDVDWSGALDRLIKVVQVRKTTRKELLESEFLGYTSDVLEAQTFFINGIEELRSRFHKETKRAKRLLGRNDSAETMREICSDIDQLIESLESRRHEKRADRMALATIAEFRARKRHFDSSLLNIVTEDERTVFKEFYEAVGDVFGRTEAVYCHDLKNGLGLAQNSLDRIRRLPVDLSEDQKSELLDELIFTKKQLKRIRDGAQAQYANIKALHDKIRLSLQSI